jgi:hypothetical protein
MSNSETSIAELIKRYEHAFYKGEPSPGLRKYHKYLQLAGVKDQEFHTDDNVWFRAPLRMLHRNHDRFWYRGKIVDESLIPAPEAVQKKLSEGVRTTIRGMRVKNVKTGAVHWVPILWGHMRPWTNTSLRPLMTDINLEELIKIQKDASEDEPCKPDDGGFGDLGGLHYLKRARDGVDFFREDVVFRRILCTIDPSLFLRLARHVPEDRVEEDRKDRMVQMMKLKAAAPAQLFLDLEGTWDDGRLKSWNQVKRVEVVNHDGRHRMMAWVDRKCANVEFLAGLSSDMYRLTHSWASKHPERAKTMSVPVVGESNPDGGTLSHVPSGLAILRITYDPPTVPGRKLGKVHGVFEYDPKDEEVIVRKAVTSDEPDQPPTPHVSAPQSTKTSSVSDLKLSSSSSQTAAPATKPSSSSSSSDVQPAIKKPRKEPSAAKPPAKVPVKQSKSSSDHSVIEIESSASSQKSNPAKQSKNSSDHSVIEIDASTSSQHSSVSKRKRRPVTDLSSDADSDSDEDAFLLRGR